jgi:EAL domain-containing protein (putative c-di-GMP-specific phosphodiesterase class I)
VENDLRRALERGELTVWYQPIVELEGGRAVGFEALLRWRHPERGLLGPDAFIGVAEETGLIAPIGEWVLGEACRQLAAWRSEYGGAGSNVSVTVNFSSRQLAKADVVERIAEILTREGIEPACFKLEITESFIVENPEVAAQVLERVRALGCRICLDDFGTGYSSLSYLLRLPIDVLKVDRSFLVDLGRGARNADIVWAVVALAERLGMQVVAEGVERESQVVHLRELGCEYGQGHYFARPMEADEAGRLFASGSAAWVETSEDEPRSRPGR